MTRGVFRPKTSQTQSNTNTGRITDVEIQSKTAGSSEVAVDPSVIPHFQFQATSFTKTAVDGDARVYPPSAPSAIDEETLSTVRAYATFDDVGGSGNAQAISTFGTFSESFTDTSFTDTSFEDPPLPYLFKVMMDDSASGGGGGTGLISYTSASYTTASYASSAPSGGPVTAWYRGHWQFIEWILEHPGDIAGTINHQNQFMRSHAVKLNVPGSRIENQLSLCYYESDTGFNVGTSFSVSLWFYPTNVGANGSEPYLYVLYRRQDANNYFVVTIDPVDGVHPLRVFVREGGTETKIKDGTGGHLTLNTWHLLNFTYNPGTNALVLYLDNVAYTDATTASLTPDYTTDSHLYIGGIPLAVDRRYTGYMDNFVFWTGKILTATEVDNMWNRGTII